MVGQGRRRAKGTKRLLPDTGDTSDCDSSVSRRILRPLPGRQAAPSSASTGLLSATTNVQAINATAAEFLHAAVALGPLALDVNASLSAGCADELPLPSVAVATNEVDGGSVRRGSESGAEAAVGPNHSSPALLGEDIPLTSNDVMDGISGEVDSAVAGVAGTAARSVAGEAASEAGVAAAAASTPLHCAVSGDSALALGSVVDDTTAELVCCAGADDTTAELGCCAGADDASAELGRCAGTGATAVEDVQLQPPEVVAGQASDAGLRTDLAVADALATVEAYFRSRFGTVTPFVRDEVGAVVGHRFAAGNGTAHSMVYCTAASTSAFQQLCSNVVPVPVDCRAEPFQYVPGSNCNVGVSNVGGPVNTRGDGSGYPVGLDCFASNQQLDAAMDGIGYFSDSELCSVKDPSVSQQDNWQCNGITLGPRKIVNYRDLGDMQEGTDGESEDGAYGVARGTDAASASVSAAFM
jgi:hypothetical protein